MTAKTPKSRSRLWPRTRQFTAVLALLAWPLVASAQETVTYYTIDAIGSVRMVTDSGGAVVSPYDYRPFGDPCGSGCGPQGATEKRQFAGLERDGETGLDYAVARHYSNAMGRFTTVDPDHVGGDLFDPQSWNAYAYARNNPLRFVDPTGLSCEPSGYQADFRVCTVAPTPSRPITDFLYPLVEFIEVFTGGVSLGAPGTGQADRPIPQPQVHPAMLAAAVVIPGGVRGAAARIVARKTTLAKTMQSEEGIAELLRGGGRVIAGRGSNAEIRDVARLVSQYGGKPGDWAKVSSTVRGHLQTHAYRNEVTGVVVEFKSIIP